jgi:hypothetical protein
MRSGTLSSVSKSAWRRRASRAASQRGPLRIAKPGPPVEQGRSVALRCRQRVKAERFRRRRAPWWQSGRAGGQPETASGLDPQDNAPNPARRGTGKEFPAAKIWRHASGPGRRGRAGAFAAPAKGLERIGLWIAKDALTRMVASCPVAGDRMACLPCPAPAVIGDQHGLDVSFRVRAAGERQRKGTQPVRQSL